MFRTAPENQTAEIAVLRVAKYYKEACTTEEARRFRLEIESYIDKRNKVCIDFFGVRYVTQCWFREVFSNLHTTYGSEVLNYISYFAPKEHWERRIALLLSGKGTVWSKSKVI
jgi:hypothetical protein